MMRDALAAYEDQKARELAESEKKEAATVNLEKDNDDIFTNAVPDYEFDKEFDIRESMNLADAFGDFSKDLEAVK